MDGAADLFETHRGYLTGIAYRMLGSLSEAEDMLQEAWLRWRGATRDEIQQPRAFLRTVVTRLCLDQLRSARARREEYVGPWLPEPLVGEDPTGVDAQPLARDVTFSLMLALERLTPPQRAAFLLHDVFEVPFAEVAETIGQSEAACRQLAARARKQVRDSHRRYPTEKDEAERLTAAFLAAARDGDVDRLRAVFAEDVVVYTDGGGRRPAALNVLRGRERAVGLFAGLHRKRSGRLPEVLYLGPINGSPGLITLESDGLPQALSVEVVGERIVAVYIVRNPEKLRLVPRQSTDGYSDFRVDGPPGSPGAVPRG